MENLRKKFDNLVNTREEIIQEIKKLEEDENVKRYLKLCKENDALYDRQLDIYKHLLLEKYKTCNHVFVTSDIENDYDEGRTHKTCGCIKCGLDYGVINILANFRSSAESAMYKYIESIYFNTLGKKTNIICDLELAQAIYNKIKENYLEIDDETAIRYLENALDNIRNTKVNDERKISRAKRLSLSPKFKRWM